jgi:hypothetical protein
MRKFTKRSAAIATAAVVAVGGAGAAYAAWFLGGSGAGAATASTASGLIVKDLGATGPADNVTVTPAFFPGSTNSVAFTVENPNPFPVRITTITLTVGNGTVASGVTGTCASDNVTVKAADLPTDGSLVVPAKTTATGNGTSTITYAGALSMVETAADACQGASFPITVGLTANSGTTPATQ